MQNAKPPPEIVWVELTFAGQTFRIVRADEKLAAEILHDGRFQPVVAAALDVPTRTFVRRCLDLFGQHRRLQYGRAPNQLVVPEAGDEDMPVCIGKDRYRVIIRRGRGTAVCLRATPAGDFLEVIIREVPQTIVRLLEDKLRSAGHTGTQGRRRASMRVQAG